MKGRPELLPRFSDGQLACTSMGANDANDRVAHILNDVVIPIFCGGGDCPHFCSSFNR